MQFEIKQNGNYIDASDLFTKLEKVVELDQVAGVDIDRKHPAQKLINRFSGQYLSPTIIKGFYECPCKQIIQSTTPFVAGAALEIGTSVHSILEDFYNLPPEERKHSAIIKIMDEVIKSRDQQASTDKIKMYIDGFWETKDYLTGLPVVHSAVECYNEVFTKGIMSPLGVELPLSVYCLADRVDFREEGVFILDYKTGTYLRPSLLTMDGYLPQLICYKWGIEAEYGVDVAGAYLLTPGVNPKSFKMDITLENESRYIEKIFKYCDEIKPIAESRIYQEKPNRYCSSCPFSKYCNAYNNTKDDKTITLDYIIPEVQIDDIDVDISQIVLED